MLSCWRAVGSVVLALTLIQWQSGLAFLEEASQEQPLDPSLGLGMVPASPSSEEKSAIDLAARLLLLEELVSLENDVIETKKKRSFSGFGSPLDRLSASSVDLKNKQRKVMQLPKRRFGLPLDRIGVNRLSNSRDLPALIETVPSASPTAEGTSKSSNLLSLPNDFAVKNQIT